MDPTATLRIIMESLPESDTASLVHFIRRKDCDLVAFTLSAMLTSTPEDTDEHEAIQNLLTWVNRGGFLPVLRSY